MSHTSLESDIRGLSISSKRNVLVEEEQEEENNNTHSRRRFDKITKHINSSTVMSLCTGQRKKREIHRQVKTATKEQTK